VSAGVRNWVDAERLRSGSSPVWIILLVVAFLSLAIVYAGLTPPFEGADAGGHFRYIAFLCHQRRLPSIDLETAAASHELVQQPPLYYALAALITPDTALAPALAQEVVNPYYGLGLAHRATVSVPGDALDLRALWIARYVSIAGGALAVLGTWLLVYELLLNPWAAFAAASIVGLNPQFLSVSANITNDSWPAATAAFTLWLAVRCVHRSARSLWAWLGVGAVAGLAALSKYSNLLVILPLGFITLTYLWKLRWRAGLALGFTAAAGAIISAGFWYLPNLARYGSPLPLGRILAVLPGLARDQALGPGDIWRQMPVVLHSYWGIYGYGILAQPWFYQITQWFMVVGACGLVVFLLRRRRRSAPGTQTAVFMSLLWLAGILASFVNFMRLVRYTDQGRLLFPAAPAVATLLLVGWLALCPKRLQAWLCRLIPVAMIVLALSQIPILREGYRIPPPLAQPLLPERPIYANFEGGMNLVGVDLPLGAGLDAHGGLPITLYLEARQPITGFYTLFLHLADDKNHPLWQFDGVPAGGRHPTRQWVPGQVFADTYIVRAGDVPADGLATLSIGFYDYRDPAQPQPLLNGGPRADRVALKVRLHAQRTGPGAPDAPPRAAWSNGVQLQATDITYDAAGNPSRVALGWEAKAPVQVDYTVSVQVLDDQNHVLAQVDKQPMSGEYPTSTWRAGDRVEDEYVLPQVPAGWQRVIVLLYDLSGQRLALQHEYGADDSFEIARRNR